MNCNQIVWYRKSVKIIGQDIPTANVGGWTFNVHHKLNEQYTYKYYLTTDPVDGRLYISDYHRRQIIRLIKIESIENLKTNYEIVIGDGNYCTIDFISNITCGDKQLAKDVSLSYPKG